MTSSFAPYSDLTLITLKDADPTQSKFIRAWAVARLLLLLYEYDLEVLSIVELGVSRGLMSTHSSLFR